MPFNRNPPPMPASPPTWNDIGLAGCNQAECVYGKFGDTNGTRMDMTGPAQRLTGPIPEGIALFSSGGMSCCSAVFLRCPHDGGFVGAAIHFDGGGDPEAAFRKVLGYYGLNNAGAIATAQTFLVTHASLDMTGAAAWNCLTQGGLPAPTQYSHNGAAGMDAAGNVFDYYM